MKHGTTRYTNYRCRCDVCREAINAYSRERYKTYKFTDVFKENSRRSSIARGKRQREWIQSFKNVPCMDCNNTYPAVCMDFDHRDPSTKSFNIGARVHRSKKSLINEIEKCDIVCANCHRIRTYLAGK